MRIKGGIIFISSLRIIIRIVVSMYSSRTLGMKRTRKGEIVFEEEDKIMQEGSVLIERTIQRSSYSYSSLARLKSLYSPHYLNERRRPQLV